MLARDVVSEVQGLGQRTEEESSEQITSELCRVAGRACDFLK